VKRSLLDLELGTLHLEDTRVVVDGRAEDSDGKSAAGRRMISLDPYTVKHLVGYLAKIDEEAKAHGRAEPWEYLAVGPTGDRLHPDTFDAPLQSARGPGRRSSHSAARREAHLRHFGDGCRRESEVAQRSDWACKRARHLADLHPPVHQSRPSNGRAAEPPH
jgi:hypothetical protein